MLQSLHLFCDHDTTSRSKGAVTIAYPTPKVVSQMSVKEKEVVVETTRRSLMGCICRLRRLKALISSMCSVC